MADYLTHGLILSFIYFQLAILVIVISNILILHRAKKHLQPDTWPSVSILVPARNEEKNIGNCVWSLLEQDYPSYDVIVLDDQSSDSTPAILEQMALEHPQLKFVAGIPPQKGFSGKNWACAQLANCAQGDLLLFTDADTIFNPKALKQLVASMLGEKADLLTGLPHQQLGSWGERLFVPFFSWAILCFVPLWLAYRTRLPGLSSAVGQMMLFNRHAYFKIGGHEKLGLAFVEDLELARRIKAAGFRWRVMNITDIVGCRMYWSSKEAFAGFSKNLFACFDFRLLPFLFAYIWLGLLFLEPFFILATKLLGIAPTASPIELGVCISLSLLVWCLAYFELGFPPLLSLIYPITMIANEVVALKSLVDSLRGRLTWKGRQLTSPKWKWL
jgi:chlorobactene glucosyltransferase